MLFRLGVGTGSVYLCLALALAFDDSCWSGPYNAKRCCDAAFGQQGNLACWDTDSGYTFERCCGLHAAVAVPDQTGHFRTRLLEEAVSVGGDMRQLSISHCEHVFRFSTAGTLLSRYIAFSGDPAGALLPGGRDRGNRDLCVQHLQADVWIAEATVYDNSGNSRKLHFDICIPTSCSQPEVVRIAELLLKPRLDSLQVPTEATVEVIRLHGTISALPFGVYFAVVMAILSIMVGIGDALRESMLQGHTWGPRRMWNVFSPLSARGALDELFSEDGDTEVFEAHCLRVLGTCAQCLNHFMIMRYPRMDESWLPALRLLQWCVTSFFVLSVYLLIACFPRQQITVPGLLDRFWRKASRQGAMIFATWLLTRHAIPWFAGDRNIAPLPAHTFKSPDGGHFSWLNLLLTQAGVPWQYIAEFWQWVIVGVLLATEALSKTCGRVAWLVLCIAALPTLWDSSDLPLYSPDSSPLYDGPHMFKFWSVRAPFCAIMVPVLRSWGWLCSTTGVSRRLRVTIGCVVAPVSMISVTRLVLWGSPVLNELSFAVPVLLLLPSSMDLQERNKVADFRRSGTKCKSDVEARRSRGCVAAPYARMCILLASRISPIITLMEYTLVLVFDGSCPPIDASWQRVLCLQGPLYLAWIHVYCAMLWIFLVRPFTRLVTGIADAVPKRVVREFLVPSIVAILLFVNWDGLVAKSYFRHTPAQLQRLGLIPTPW